MAALELHLYKLTFEDENVHKFRGFVGISEVLIEKFKGHGLSWCSYLLGVPKCMTRWKQTSRAF